MVMPTSFTRKKERDRQKKNGQKVTNNKMRQKKKRAHSELNRGPLDLQSNALPLSYTPVDELLKRQVTAFLLNVNTRYDILYAAPCSRPVPYSRLSPYSRHFVQHLVVFLQGFNNSLCFTVVPNTPPSPNQHPVFSRAGKIFSLPLATMEPLPKNQSPNWNQDSKLGRQSRTPMRRTAKRCKKKIKTRELQVHLVKLEDI